MSLSLMIPATWSLRKIPSLIGYLDLLMPSLIRTFIHISRLSQNKYIAYIYMDKSSSMFWWKRAYNFLGSMDAC